MIEQPPSFDIGDVFAAIAMDRSEETSLLIEKINDEYEYWDKVKYKPLPNGVESHEDLWMMVRATRYIQQRPIWNDFNITLYLTNQMQKWCHEFDMNFGGSWGTNAIISDENRERYLVSSLMEEAISSSQMEGASTTRKVAKEMLRKHITPRDKSQQMIFNNYQTIRYIVERKDMPLSSEMLCTIHRLMTDNTLDNPEDAGRYRTNNDVVVEDGITHETVHTPPSCEKIPQFIDELCEFFNGSKSKIFIHPIIRGIIIHFMIAYVHPFADGNGRTARAIFYWYMLKQGYWLTEYLSISRIIASSKKSYEKAFLCTEADRNDIGYFVNYNLRVLEKAFRALQYYIKRKQDERQAAGRFIRLGNINERQAQIINMFCNEPEIVITVKDLQGKFGVSPTTAKTDIVGLLDRGILLEVAFNKVKKGYVKGPNFEAVAGL